jgi:hypothetical protein
MAVRTALVNPLATWYHARSAGQDFERATSPGTVRRDRHADGLAVSAADDTRSLQVLDAMSREARQRRPIRNRP